MAKVSQKNKIRRNIILRALLDNGQMSLTEIRDKTGITIPVASGIINSLKKKNLIIEVKQQDAKQAGRPPYLVKLNGKAGYILGVDLGRVYNNIVVLDLEQNVIHYDRKKIYLLGNEEDVLGKITDELDRILREANLSWDSCLGIGFSIPGIVNGPEGTSDTYLKIGDKPLRQTLREYFNKPVHIEHDVKSMTLGELWFGEAKQTSNSLCLKVDYGIGLGIIIDGKIYYGNNSYSGEFGHISVVNNGKLCYCGKRGCLETVASGRFLVEEAKERIAEGIQTLLMKQEEGDIENINQRNIIECANNGDEFCIELLEEAAKNLGIGCATLINLFDPAKIILAGEIGNLVSKLFVDQMKSTARKKSLMQLNKNVEFVSSTLGSKAGALGVAMLAARDLFEIEHLNPFSYF